MKIEKIWVQDRSGFQLYKPDQSYKKGGALTILGPTSASFKYKDLTIDMNFVEVIEGDKETIIGGDHGSFIFVHKKEISFFDKIKNIFSRKS